MDILQLPLRAASVTREKARWLFSKLGWQARVTEDANTSTGTKLQDLPTEVIIEILDYLSVKHQTLRSTCQQWNHIINNLYEVIVDLNSENAELFSKCQARFCQVTIAKKIGEPGEALLSASCFYSHIEKLELMDIWGTTTGFQVLKHTVTLKELVLKYTSTSDANQVVDVGDEERLGVKDLEEREDVASWLPGLTKLDFQALDGHKEFLRLVALIVRRGRLTRLQMELGIDDESTPKELLLDFLLEDGVVGSNLQPNYSIHSLAWKILNWNRNSLVQIRLRPGVEYPDMLFNGNTAEFEICLDQSGISEDKLVDRIRSFCGWIWPKDDRAVIGEPEIPDMDNWIGLRSRIPLCQVLRTLKKLRAVKLGFFPFFDSVGKAREMEAFPVEIILQNAATLTTISLQFSPTDEFFTDRTFLDTEFAAVFSKCVSLKKLEVRVVDIFDDDRVEWVQPKFRGIEILPESLIYFGTSFPIVVPMDERSTFSLRQSLNLNLEAPNLARLETVCLYSPPYFMSEDLQLELWKLDRANILQLKAKLPKLTTMSVNISTRVPTKGIETLSGNPHVTTELAKLFAHGLKFKNYMGTFLEMDI